MAEIVKTTPAAMPTFDLAQGKKKDLFFWVDALHKWLAANPKEVVVPPNGWYDITPDMALDFMRLDKPGANREVDLSTIRYYGNQMQEGEWKRTGQGVLISQDKVLIDARHRMLACILTGATFPSYVITDVPPEERLFAYIDNSRARSPAAGLETAGYNGRSQTMSQVIKLIDQFGNGALTNTAVQPRPRMSPAQYLAIADQHPMIKDACRIAASVYGDTVLIFLDHKPIVAFLALMLLERYGRDVTDAFFEELQSADPADYNAKVLNDPFTALRALLLSESKKDKKMMKAHQVLGCAIKAFNLWREEKRTKRISLRVEDAFPSFTTEVAEVTEDEEEDAGPPAAQEELQV